MNKIVLGLSLMFASFAQAYTVHHVNLFSPSMKKEIPVKVVTPDGYEKSDLRYPSIYTLHGANGSAGGNLVYVTNFVDQVNAIVISPDGGRTSWWVDSPIDPSYQYETFVIKELIPHIDAHFRTDARKTKRAIFGGSMGGHGACYLAFRHKELFGVVGNIFGGVDIRPFPNNWEIKKRLGEKKAFPERWTEFAAITHAPLIQNGDLELISVIGTSDFFLQVNRNLHQLLTKNKVKHTYIEYRGPDEVSCRHGRPFILSFALPIIYQFIDNYFKTGRAYLGLSEKTR